MTKSAMFTRLAKKGIAIEGSGAQMKIICIGKSTKDIVDKLKSKDGKGYEKYYKESGEIKIQKDQLVSVQKDLDARITSVKEQIKYLKTKKTSQKNFKKQQGLKS